MTDVVGRLTLLRADVITQWEKLGKLPATLVWLPDSAFSVRKEGEDALHRLAHNLLSEGVLHHRQSVDRNSSSGRVYLELSGDFPINMFGCVNRHRATDVLHGLLRKVGGFFRDSPDVRFDTLDPLLGKTWFATPSEPPQRIEDYRDPPSMVDHALIWLLNPVFGGVAKHSGSNGYGEARIEIPDPFGLLIHNLDKLLAELQHEDLPNDEFRSRATADQKELFRFIRCKPGMRVSIDEIHRWKSAQQAVQRAAVLKSIRGLADSLLKYAGSWRLEWSRATKGDSGDAWLMFSGRTRR